MGKKIAGAIFAVFLGILMASILELETAGAVFLVIIFGVIGYFLPIFTIIGWIFFLFVGTGGGHGRRR